jgi:DNA mismatch repair protein MutS
VNDFFFDLKLKKIIIERFDEDSFKDFGLNQKEIVRACGALVSYIKEMQSQGARST